MKRPWHWHLCAILQSMVLFQMIWNNANLVQSNTYYQQIIPTNMLFLVTTLLGIIFATNNLHGALMQLECPMIETPMLVMCLLHLFKLHQNENIWPTTQIFNLKLFNYWLLICRAYIYNAFDKTNVEQCICICLLIHEHIVFPKLITTQWCFFNPHQSMFLFFSTIIVFFPQILFLSKLLMMFTNKLQCINW